MFRVKERKVKKEKRNTVKTVEKEVTSYFFVAVINTTVNNFVMITT